MDTLILILTALQAAPLASSLVKKNDSVKDAYISLRERIQQKFANRPGAELALSEYEADPATWEAPLKKALVQAQADQDRQIIEAAQYVVKLLSSLKAITDEYTLQVSGSVQGSAQNNYQSIAIIFDDERREM